MSHHKRPVIVMLLLTIVVCLVTSLPASMNLPLIDPGLFVISGVTTCGESFGYCLLGSDCTMDDDLLADSSGNCDGLKRAFTPSAPFVCCKFNKKRLQSKVPITNSGTKIGNSNETRFKLPKNIRENIIDYSKIENDQLAKLNQIGLVVKKIVEQLINESANNIKADEIMFYKKEKLEENTIRNEIKEELPINTNETEIIETTINPSKIEEITSVDENLKTEMPLDNKDIMGTNKCNTTEERTDELTIGDEFKYEKDICQKICKSEVTFIVEKKPICYGTLLDALWILTSATCASRLNKADIRKVVVSRKDLVGSSLSISNILVHENFKSPISNSAPENNDLALVSLTVPLEDQECIPCFSQRSTMTKEVCKNSQNSYFKNSVKTTENCEGLVQQRKLINNNYSYFILPCSSWRMQYNQEGRLGSGLWCDSKLAGVQTGVGVGSLIYTPVNEYTEWISDNKRIEK